MVAAIYAGLSFHPYPQEMATQRWNTPPPPPFPMMGLRTLYKMALTFSSRIGFAGHSQSGHVRTGASGSAQATAWALKALVRLVYTVLRDAEGWVDEGGAVVATAVTAAGAVAALERMQARGNSLPSVDAQPSPPGLCDRAQQGGGGGAFLCNRAQQDLFGLASLLERGSPGAKASSGRVGHHVCCCPVIVSKCALPYAD